MTPTNHKNVGRTVHSAETDGPAVYINCRTCGQEFVQFPTRTRPTVLYCPVCLKTNYDAWYATYCPETSGKAAKAAGTKAPKAEKAPQAPRSATQKAQDKVTGLQDRIAALKAIIAAKGKEGA